MLIAGLLASLDDSEPGLTEPVIDSRVASSFASLQGALRSWTEVVRAGGREMGEPDPEPDDPDADDVDIGTLAVLYVARFRAAQDLLVRKRRLAKDS